MNKVFIKAEPRNIIGRQVKSLRKRGFVPAVIYGHGFASRAIQMPTKELERAYSEAGESTIVYVDVEGESHPTIIHGIARDPVNDKLLHADFYKVRLDEKIRADIELNFVGESPAVKEMGGILIKNMSEIEVEGFPQDLPHEITVDISSLTGFNSQITVKDLPISAQLKIEADLEAVVALIQEPISEEELKAQLETPAATAEDVEVIKKEKEEEEPAEEGKTAESVPEDKKE